MSADINKNNGGFALLQIYNSYISRYRKRTIFSHFSLKDVCMKYGVVCVLHKKRYSLLISISKQRIIKNSFPETFLKLFGKEDIHVVIPTLNDPS